MNEPWCILDISIYETLNLKCLRCDRSMIFQEDDNGNIYAKCPSCEGYVTLLLSGVHRV